MPTTERDAQGRYAPANASPAVRVGGYGFFVGSDRDGEAFAAAVE